MKMKMKKFIKDMKKSGLPGFVAKRNVKLFGLAAMLLVAFGAMMFAGGDLFGMTCGTMLAAAPLFALAIPEGDWSDEEKKVLNKLAEGFSKQLNDYFEKNISKEELYKSISEKLEENGFKQERIAKFENAIKTLEDEIGKMQKQVEKEDKTLAAAIVKAIKEKTKANTVEELQEYLKANPHVKDETLVIKDAIMTTDMTGDIGTTNMDRRVGWQYARRLAILPYLRTVYEQSGKGKFGYTEGTYTSNAGYAAEADNKVTGDAATAVEKTRAYAKISAWQTVSTETYEDLPDFAMGLVHQLRYGALLFADKEAYNGNGADGSQPNHIYGILPVATAFDDTTYAASVEKANIADLFAAVQNQINSVEGAPFVANIAWMNNLDLFKMRRLKDADGQPLVNLDLFGNPTVGGVRIVTNSMFTANTLLMADTDCIELRVKRDMTLEMGKILPTDRQNDTQSAILFARLQILVRDRDKKGIVKVTDVKAAIGKMNIAETTDGGQSLNTVAAKSK